MMGNELGQIKPGFLADILLVDGNPLANVKILQDADKLVVILKDSLFTRSSRARTPRAVTSPDAYPRTTRPAADNGTFERNGTDRAPAVTSPTPSPF